MCYDKSVFLCHTTPGMFKFDINLKQANCFEQTIGEIKEPSPQNESS